MKLEKINYSSAVYFGALTLVMYLVMGALQWFARDSLMALQIMVEPMQVFVYAPLIGAISAYVISLIAIVIYNIVAKKFPIAWAIKK
jgi:hypothetical protein